MNAIQRFAAGVRIMRWVVIGFAVGALCGVPRAEAYQVKRVIKGSATFLANTEVMAVSLATGGVDIDMGKSFVMTSNSINNTDRNPVNVMAVLDDPQTVILSRATSAVDTVVDYYVAEFVSGVTVISGITTVSESTLTKNITLPVNIDRTKAFPIVSYKMLNTRTNSMTTRDEMTIYSADLTADNILTLSRGDNNNNSGYNDEVYYQVVIFDRNVNVQRGTATITSSPLTLTAPTDFTAVDPAKTFLIFTTKPALAVNGVEAQYCVDGVLTSGSQMDFRRVTTTNSVEIRWFLVSFDNEVLSQSGRSSFTGTTYSVGSADGFTTALFHDASLGRSLSRISVSGGGASDAQSLDEICVRGLITDTQTLSLARSTVQTTTVNVAWSVLELPLLDLTAPNGGEVWEVGTAYNITWKHSDQCALDPDGGGAATHHRVTLSLSTDGGSTYPLTIASGLDATADAYSWSVPSAISSTNLIGENLKIKIADTDVASRNFDTSDAPFIVKGKITLAQPPDTWRIGQSQNIQWTYTGDMEGKSPATVTIKLSTDGATFDHTVSATASVGTGGAGSYSWTIPSAMDGANLIGTTNRIQITSNYNPAPTGSTLVQAASGNFVLKGQLSNLAPTTSETWLLGETKTITWTKKGYLGGGSSDGTVNLYYSYNGGLSYDSIPFALNVPAGTDAGGGSYQWDVPLTLATSNPTSMIKVVQSNDSTVYGESAAFTVIGSLDVDAPVGGEIWRYGESKSVKWTPHGTIDYVVIKYKVGAADWAYCVGAAPSDNLAAGAAEVQQTFTWTIPNVYGKDNVYLRVCTKVDETIYDEAGPFSIKGVISVSEPHLDEIVKVTNAVEQNKKIITWANEGVGSGTADIRISYDGGTSWSPTPLTEGTVGIGAGSFEWTVTGAHITDNAKIKVALDGDEEPVNGYVGISNAFKVTPYLKLVQPVEANLVYSIGDTVYIKWTPDPATFGTVDIRYDTNSGANGYNGFIADAVQANNVPAGESDIGYKWTIPDVAGIVGTKLRIKVYQTGKPSVSAVCPYDFSIRGTVTLTGEANGGPSVVWKVGENKTITWNLFGDLGTLNILYSTDGGNSYANSVVSGVPAGIGNGSYLWAPIPDNVISNDRNTTIRFKVQTPDGTISDTSDADLTIQGQLIVTLPNGGETLYVDDPDDAGDSYQITWNTYGQIANVKLAYDTNSGLGDDGIADNGDEYIKTIAGGQAITNLDGYSWAVPNAIGAKVRVKVLSSVAGAYVYDTSNADYEIKGKMRVVSPDAAVTGASAWKVNSADLPSSHLIEWKNFGDLGTTNVYYSDNGGAQYALLTTASGANGNQSYTWTIPSTWQGRNVIGADNRIKVTDSDDELDVFAESVNFAIKGQLAITTPGGGEIYFVGGDPIDITWKRAGDLGNIDLFFSSDNGATWSATLATIDAGYAQPYQLAVPAEVTVQGRIKIEQVSDRTFVKTVTPNPGFAIKGSVFITFPDNNPTLVKTVDSDLTITWTLTGAIQNVAIDYDTASGTGGYTGVVIGSTPAAAGSYPWHIPNDPAPVSDQVRIRIRDYNDGTVKDESAADFKIKPTLAFTVPAGGESWGVGSLKTISWSTKGFAAGQQIKIEYSDDGGNTWPGTGSYVINAGIMASAVSYGWSIPTSIPLSSQCVARISKVGDADSYALSNWFTLKGLLDVTYPDSLVNLPINTSYNIRWNKTGNVGNVALYYSSDAAHTVWTGIPGAENLPAAQGSTGFNWTVPDAPSATVKVKVVPTGASDPTDENASEGENSIVGSIFLQTPPPAGGATMVVGSPYNITWTKFGSISAFDVYYSYDDKENWTQIGNDVVSLNLSWTVEDHISTLVHFRVVDAGNPSVVSETTAASTIKGSINLTDPDGAETLTVGTPFAVTWSKTGDIGNIKIEVSTDDFASDVRTIVASTPADAGTYAWSPGINDITNTDTVRVRVTSLGGIPVFDTSVNPFKIIGAISAVSPSGSANVWYKGQTKTVSWNETGNIPAVDIYYKTAVGNPYNKVLVLNHTGHADGANSYDATVPDENSEDCWVQVRDHDNANVAAASAAAFSMRPVITVTAPTAGANIRVNSSNASGITWSLNGSNQVATVNVVYSTNGLAGPFDKTVATGVDATLGTLDWNSVANTVSSNVVVRVVDAGNASVIGNSPVFNIVGSVALTAPNGGEDWPVGASRNITWTKQGTIGNIDIYADYGSGYGGSPIATVDAESVSLWAWNPIPDQVGNSIKIRISQSTNPTVVTDESDAVFHIIGTFAFTNPNGAPLTSGDATTIDWTRGGTAVNNVKLEFFDGTAWSSINDNASNSGSYPWTVPSTTSSTNCKVRITASSPLQPATATESTAFWVHGRIDVTSPVSSDKWTIGTQQNILFNVTGEIDAVNIKYSKDGGADNYAYTISSSTAVSAGANTFAWNIPTNQDILSASAAKIKIADAAYATVYGVSQNFMVKGVLQVLTPSADNIVMTYGTLPYNITWAVTGSISDVRIYYSTNDGVTYPNEITTSAGVPATPAVYSWDIPNSIVGKHMKIKVVDKANAETSAESANTFEVIGQLSLDTPVGGEKWTIGGTGVIKWTPTGTFTNVQIQVSTNDFVSTILNTIQPAGVSAVQQTYNWTPIPDALSNNVKVRISDPDHRPDLVRDETATALKILGGLDVTAPESGQVWLKGETNRQITWDASGSVTNVKIEYKTSAAGIYTTIIADDAGHTSGPNAYTWTSGVADENSEACYVRVSEVSNYDDVYSVSAAPFSIRPRITVSAPAAASTVRVGTNNPGAVAWSLNGSLKITSVNVLYSTNGPAGPFDKTIALSVDASTGACNWNGVANDVSTNVVVKVVDAANANVFGLSGVFAIQGQIALTSPNGGQNWSVGSSQNITWTKQGTIGNVNIYADYGSGYGGTPLATVDAETTSLWAWNPIPDQVTNALKIKVASATNPTVVYDESDAVSAIAAVFNVTTPANGEVLTVGDNYDVTWTRLGAAVTNVKIEYSSNGGVDWTTVAASAVNSGTYPWTVPDAISTSCKIRVSDPNNADAKGESTGYFKIKGRVTVTSPNIGTESWSAGTTYPVTWTKNGSIASVNIYYSHNNGTDWTKINATAVDASLGTWDWYISELTPLTTQGLIRIYDASDSTVYDTSNNVFEIKGAVYLQTPNATGISLVVDSIYNITWTVFGAVQNVELHYSVNGGILGGGAYLDGNLIATVAAAGGTYAWSVPDAIGSNVRVRVRDAGNQTIWDESNNAFQIKGAVVVNVPNGGENWVVGSSHNITWTRQGSWPNAKIEYSRNGFADESQTVVIVPVTDASTGSYPWTVADAIGTGLKVRVSDAGNGAVTDVSDGSFFIKGALSLLTPNGGETWVVGTSQNITWGRTGSIANVKLEYSTDGGSTFPGVIVASTPAASGTYPWTVSDAIGLQVRVRVSDASDASVEDVSNANFIIKGSLVLTSPNGAERWAVGTSHNITWTRQGSIPTVKLEYSTDGGTSYPNSIIVSTDASTGTYTWSIPDNTTPIAKVKVTATSDDTVYDISDANFKIIGSLTLTSPNGNEGWLVGTAHNITWAMVGNISNVKLDYSTNGGTSYDYAIIASTPGGGLSYNWASIPDTVSTNVKVRISDATDVTVNDVSDTTFKIQAGFVITAPNNGEVWTVGAAESITWNKIGSAQNVLLEYSTDGGQNYTATIAASTANTGIFSWTIPDDISSTVRVRVSDTNDPTAMDASDENFKIRGSLTLTSPNGNEIWYVGSSHPVTWTRSGSIATVKLEYSTDGGVTYPGLISASEAGTAGTYAWTVPDAIDNEVRVRIADNSDGTVFDVSNANFSIKGVLALTAPNGNEQWIVNSGQNITWNRTGSIANVKLQYSTDSGDTYPYTIINSTNAALGSYSWPIPDVLSSTLRVLVSDAQDSAVSDASDADFTIKGALVISSPNGSEIWTVGEARAITWTRTGSIPTVKLEYSMNGGSTYPNLIIGVTPANTGTYAWTVPDAIGSQTRVKITDVSNETVTDASNANFTIKGALSLLTPNGSEVWAVGSVQGIIWNRTGSIANVTLEYSTNGGVAYPNVIVASTDASAGSYAWTVSDAIGTQVRVRVSDALDASIADTSDANFSIKGSLRVTSPNGGEQWGVGSSHNITWVRNGSIATVAIDYSTDGGATYPKSIVAAADAATQSYPWTIPDDINSQVKVRVTNNSDTSVYDASDTNFKIVGILHLTSPNGGEGWPVGTGRNITWTMTGSISNVRLDYSTNSGATYANNIVASTPASALAYLWIVPDAVSNLIRVKISDATDTAVFDASDADFKIQARFDVTSPDGGEVWVVGSAHDITWNRIGSTANVKLEYSTDSGQNYNATIVATTPNTGSYPWVIPDAISSAVRVKVSDVNDATAYDASAVNFKIRGGIAVTAPNGNEAWIVGTAYNITWTKVGSIANVKLEYSTDSGVTYPYLISASVGADLGVHAWTIPDTLSLTARVKVTDASDSSVYDESNADFKIRGGLIVTSPNGTETWNVGSVHNITWSRTGSIPTVKLEYSTDGGTTYPATIIATTDATTGSYAWTVPDAISNLARVRVSYTADPTVLDASDTNFKIQGVLRITSPDGGEIWDVASAHNITWTVTGSISNVKLEYSTDSGETYPNVIVASTSAGVGAYNWTIPNSISTAVRVKVTNLNDSAVNDASDADLSIVGTLTILAPNGGEVWPVGTAQSITWTRVGSIASVKLNYSLDGGVSYNNVISASTPAAAQNYSWTVPDAINSTVRIRIEDLADSRVWDVSDGNFKIRGDLILSSPNGNEVWLISSNHPIVWTKNGSITNVRLDYSVDAGVTYPFSINNSLPADQGTFNWVVPDTTSILARVKVSDAGDATVFDASVANFIIRGGFSVIAPNGGEAWSVGANQNITWSTFGSIPNVKLEFSSNNGSNWNVITNSVSNTGTYGWNIPDAISAQCLVRIYDINDPNAVDVSDAVFKVHGTLNLTSPNGNEQWGVAATQNIVWTKVGTIANVRFEFSTDGGATYPNVIVNQTPGAALTYPWTVPDSISTSVKVKISDASDLAIYDESDSVFKIKGAFTITSPNGGENWVVNAAESIAWSTFGTVANVKLEYSTDAGSSWILINASYGNTGLYVWTIPDAITTQARVRVSDSNDSTASDVSDNNFKIRGSLALTAPNGGEKWNVGSSQVITWSRVGSIANVKLEYSDNGGATYVPITNSTNNTGSYAWTVPDAITTQARVRITNVDDTTVTDTSDANFKIQGTFVLTSPNGGEAWIVGSSHDITWTTSGTINFVNLEYSTDSGVTFPYQIVTSLGNVGTYSWTVPDRVSGSVRVRVVDTSDPEALDMLNANLRIRTTLILTYPNGGEVLKVGSSYNVTWTSVGAIPNVQLEYSRFNFLTDINTITAATANDGSFSWTVPDAISNTVKVRVADPNDYGARDDSDGQFRIITAFAVTSPNGGEMWDVDSVQNLTWTCTSSPANVPDIKLEYSTDGGATYPYIIGATENDGIYPWMIPDAISAAFKVRVSDLADPTAFDASDANAKIRAKFTVVQPNGGQIWTVGQAYDVTWTTVGTVSNVRLDYSTNDFASSSSIIASTPNDGTHPWTIPDSISTTVKARVMSATDTDAFDVSDNAFKIRGDFSVTAPNGSELWFINQSFNVTWNTVGTIPNVRLMYSTDSGSTFSKTIVNSVANTNSYAWLVPDDPTPTARVRLYDAADPTVYDDSNANFRIRGFFTLTSPNGGESWVVGTSRSVTWVKGGTIGYKLSYSTDGGATYPNAIVTVADPSQNTGSYAWTVPNSIGKQVRVKIEDPNDFMTFDESDADFTIRGAFLLSAPNGGERWVTNEARAITWTTTAGDQTTIPAVKIEYSKDNFAGDLHVIAASAENTGTYTWTVPDDRSMNSVRVRVSDVTNPETYDVSDAPFSIDYYHITWEVRDLLTNELVSNLTVAEYLFGTEIYGWRASGLTTPITHDTPYGYWTTGWSASGFGEKAVNFTADHDQSFLLFLETTAIHIWRAYSEFAYTADTDTMGVTSWLERDGFAVSGASRVDVYIYDGPTVIKTLSSTTPTAAGFFPMTWESTGLSEGKVYAVLTDITNASGAHFKTPTSFQITESKRLQATQQAVEDMRDVTLPAFQSSVSTLITTKLNDQTNLITDKMNEQKQIIVDKTNEMVSSVNTTLTSFETKSDAAIKKLQAGADQAVSAGQELEATAKKYSWKATVSPNPALSGDVLTFSCQGPSGFQPMIDIYNYDNKIITLDRPMFESAEGLYTFTVKATNDLFTAGQAYTYIITEQLTGGMVTGSGMVETTSITTIAGLAAAAPEAERASKKVLEAVTALQNVLISENPINIGLALTNLQNSIEELPSLLREEGGSGSAQAKVLNDVAEKLRSFIGEEEGLDLSAMLEEALGENPTIKEIRSKTESIQGVIKFLQQLFESKFGGLDAPIVSTSLAPGSVKFRIAVANPSRTKTQTVPVKIYLPQEVKPKDIMDLGGMTLEYDQDKSIYYVYANDVQMAPLESRVFEVEVEDIWFVDQTEMDGLRAQAAADLARLKNSDYFETARTIVLGIQERLDTIAKTQADETMSREQHIGLYRSNMDEVKRIKEDIARLEKMLVAIGAMPEPAMLDNVKLRGTEPSRRLTWIVIFVILIFIGLLAVVFFFTWNSQVKASEGLIQAARKSSFPERKSYSVEEGEKKNP